MIVYGTGSYSLKTFTSSDLGLNPLHYDGYRFQILQRYAHVFWIPFFPIGREYAMQMPGRSEKYIAPFDVAEIMKQRDFPKFNALLAFAIPILLVGGLTIFGIGSSISQKMSQSRYEESMRSQKEELAALAANKDAIQPYVDKVNSLYDIIDTNYAQVEPLIDARMDTSETGLFTAYIQALSSQLDTIAPMTPTNTIVQFNSFDTFLGTHTEVKPDMIQTNDYSGMSVWKWYREGMPLTEDLYFDAAEVKMQNEKLDSLKYFAIVRYTGAAKPFIMSGGSSLNSVFQSGFGMADIYIYEIASKELLGTVTILAENSEELRFTTNSAYGGGETYIRLNRDLAENVSREIDYALRFRERPQEIPEEYEEGTEMEITE